MSLRTVKGRTQGLTSLDVNQIYMISSASEAQRCRQTANSLPGLTLAAVAIQCIISFITKTVTQSSGHERSPQGRTAYLAKFNCSSVQPIAAKLFDLKMLPKLFKQATKDVKSSIVIFRKLFYSVMFKTFADGGSGGIFVESCTARHWSMACRSVLYIRRLTRSVVEYRIW